MIIRTLALAGAATLMLGGMAYAGNSTPAEQAQTRQLNAESLQAAQNGTPVQTLRNTIADSGQSNRPMQTASNTEANSQMTSGSDMSMSNGSMGANPQLSQVANPPSALSSAAVKDNAGMTIGAVQKVQLGGDGMAKSVDVALNDSANRVVAVDASALSYDQKDNTLTARMSSDQLKALPAAPKG